MDMLRRYAEKMTKKSGEKFRPGASSSTRLVCFSKFRIATGIWTQQNAGVGFGVKELIKLSSTIFK